ncbi:MULTISPECIES: GntR family transcriptional regulator [Bradyrhizobium]|uniref:GntR family transcriptional regulator n=1 Tax=Bradyrhizobium TaxID=374 RepID=UPI00140EA065|nr:MULTISPECIES: GntR family transcriptional regulator [Bradyrhizobium]MBR0906356.1 GntR family transcriptional regulator [Bradyrhizobium liaoningense]QIO31775.1 GntR family transcriptional regulator [Bradyrhizobium sp. 1(2017)]
MNRKEALAVGEAFEAVERSSLSRQAYNQLRKALMVGELQPGQKLSGREIALRLGTSLTPVREALLQLVAEGVLELRTGHSITVPVPTRAVYTELRDIRAQTEGLGAERAAAIITQAGIKELADVHERLVTAKREGDYALALRCNEAFHLGLCREAQMPRLFRVVESLWTQMGPFLNFLYKGPEGWPPPKGEHFHCSVLTALKQRDGAAARQAIVEDIIGGGAGLLDKLAD